MSARGNSQSNFSKDKENPPLPLNSCVNLCGSYKYWINSLDKYVIYKSAKQVFLTFQSLLGSIIQGDTL